MNMSILDVCKYLYPGQVEVRNIMMGMNPGEVPFITYWNVSNIDQPSIDYLVSQIPIFQRQFDLDDFKTHGAFLLSKHIDNIAKERQYDSALTCLSYAMSTNEQWQKEADAFISWRDSVFLYTIEQITLMESGERPIPTFDEFQTELPLIMWP